MVANSSGNAFIQRPCLINHGCRYSLTQVEDSFSLHEVLGSVYQHISGDRKSVNTRDLNAQVGTMVEAVSYRFTYTCVATPAQKIEDEPAYNSRNMTNHNMILNHSDTVLVVTK